MLYSVLFAGNSVPLCDWISPEQRYFLFKLLFLFNYRTEQKYYWKCLQNVSAIPQERVYTHILCLECNSTEAKNCGQLPTRLQTDSNAYSLTLISTNAHCFPLVTTGFYRAFKSMGMYRTWHHQRIIIEIYNCTYKYEVNMIQKTTVVDQAVNLSSGNISTEITEPRLLPFLP